MAAKKRYAITWHDERENGAVDWDFDLALTDDEAVGLAATMRSNRQLYDLTFELMSEPRSLEWLRANNPEIWDDTDEDLIKILAKRKTEG